MLHNCEVVARDDTLDHRYHNLILKAHGEWLEELGEECRGHSQNNDVGIAHHIVDVLALAAYGNLYPRRCYRG